MRPTAAPRLAVIPSFIKSKLTLLHRLPQPPETRTTGLHPPDTAGPLPVDDAAARPQVLRPEQAAVQREVLQEGGLALRRGVDVAVVADGQQRLQAVLHHAGHRHGNQPVRLVVLEDVAPLAVQQQHDGLQEGGSR